MARRVGDGRRGDATEAVLVVILVDVGVIRVVMPGDARVVPVVVPTPAFFARTASAASVVVDAGNVCNGVVVGLLAVGCAADALEGLL